MSIYISSTSPTWAASSQAWAGIIGVVWGGLHLWAVVVVLGRRVIVRGWVIGGRDFVCGSGAWAVVVVCGRQVNDHGQGVVGVVWGASFVGGRRSFLGAGSSFMGRLLVVVLVSGPRSWAVRVVCGRGVVALYGVVVFVCEWGSSFLGTGSSYVTGVVGGTACRPWAVHVVYGGR
jgi:hypothetical protein